MAYTGEVDELVEKIIDEAIKFYMSSHGWQLNFQGNYEREMGSDGVQITPPGKPERASGGQVLGFGVPFVDGFEYGSGSDAGTRIYRHFETTVRDMFRPWRNISDPENFESYVEQFREAAWTISMTGEGNKVSGVGNPELKVVDPAGEDLRGRHERGDDPRVRPELLHSVAGGDPRPVRRRAARRRGAVRWRIWRKAREDVLTIAHRTLDVVRHWLTRRQHGLGIVTPAFAVAALFPTPIQPVLAGVAAALPALGAAQRRQSAVQTESISPQPPTR